MKETLQEFGIFIKQKRLENGLTQEEVAKKLGISQVSYGRYELGMRDPGLEFICEISSALGFEPKEFFEYLEGRLAKYKLRD